MIIFLICNPAPPQIFESALNKWYSTRMMSNDDHFLAPVVDIVPAYWYTQRNATCVSNGSSVGLQFLSQSNGGGKYLAIANQYKYNTARTYNGIFGTGNFTTKYCITRL